MKLEALRWPVTWRRFTRPRPASIGLFKLQQLSVQPERQPQHPVGISGACAHASADGGAAAIKTRAHAEAHAAAVAVFDPIGHGFAVVQRRHFIRRPQFRHRLVVSLISDAAVPIHLGCALAAREDATQHREQNAETDGRLEGDFGFHGGNLAKPSRECKAGL